MSEARPTRKSSGRTLRVLGLLAGAGIGMICVVAYWIWMFSSPIAWQEITPELLQQARQKWQRNQPENYDIEIKFDGPRAAVYRLEVRNGRAFAATQDGQNDAQTLRRWSVQGMFDTIEQDLKHATDPIRVSRREVNYVTPLGVFHPKYGYPQHYRRVQWGFNVEVTWEVTKFSVVDAGRK